ncbi:hypothetical protein GCM10009716_31930 [Streptomyces sodiiphilus]|uniref:LysM domain-containing protein n=1 Tax=Streptomyces sodiiphilus TaxID=226217 RepID=A0ABN2PI18_9ACTN
MPGHHDTSQRAATENRYPRSSRYHGIGTAVHTLPDGRQVPYLKRRLLPRLDETGEPVSHTVGAGERPDLLAHRYLGSAGQWWRIADANPVLDPAELTSTPGATIVIPLPGGAGHA